MDEDRPLKPKPAWRTWVDPLISFGPFVAWMAACLFFTGAYPHWTPVVYRVGHESDPLRFPLVGTLGECQSVGVTIRLGISQGGGRWTDWGDLCMRRCYFLEERIRPHAVREIAGQCQVVVDSDVPQRSDLPAQ